MRVGPNSVSAVHIGSGIWEILAGELLDRILSQTGLAGGGHIRACYNL